MSIRHRARLAAVALGVAAAGVVVPSPAQAAACGTASGVSVVVDFHQLGGGAQSFCDASGAGENAAHQFTDAGYDLTYVDGEPFVCQVDGKPSTQCQQTPPGNAYWSLWWSDGKSGQWKYASVGVGQLKVPDGGYVALSWQGQASQAKPRVPATAHSSSPSSAPTSHPTSRPTAHPTSHPTSTSAPSAGSTAAPSSSSATSPGRSHHRRTSRHHPTPGGQARATGGHTQAAPASGQVAPTQASSASSGSGGLPTWVAPIAIAALFLGAGAIVLARRGNSGGA